jgi:hypothetical protein
LYWGPLATVEDVRRVPPRYDKPESNDDSGKSDHAPVEGAMVAFGDALRDGADAGTLQERSLALAHAVREEIRPRLDARAYPLESLNARVAKTPEAE